MVSISQVHSDTLDGLADVVDAGRIIDGDQVLAWIESWGSESELPPPLCEDRVD